MLTKMTMIEAGRLGYEASLEGRELARQKRIEEYNKNPLKCQECLCVMPYDKIIKRKPSERKFCSRSCSAKYGNKKFPKRSYCGKSTKNPWSITKDLIEELKSIPEGCNKQRIARRYFLEEYGNVCSRCKLTEWNNQPIPVVLDHINGNPEDYNLSNLRLLCCNCDAQTPTYKGKNVGNGRHSRRQRYKNGLSY